MQDDDGKQDDAACYQELCAVCKTGQSSMNKRSIILTYFFLIPETHHEISLEIMHRQCAECGTCTTEENNTSIQN